MEPPPYLSQAWVHSHEEDTRDRMVFRPKTYAFPPSRGRHGFELQPGGKLIAAAPGPSDIPGTSDGTWEMKSPDRLALLDASGSREMRIVSLTPDKLVLTSL